MSLKLNLLLCKRHCQGNKKTNHTLGENICKRHICNRTIIQNIQKNTPNSTIRKQLHFLNEPKTLTDTSPKKIYGWQISIWKDGLYLMSSGKRKSKWWCHCRTIGMAQTQNTDTTKWNTGNSHSLLVGIQNSTPTLEDSLVVSYRTNRSLNILSSSCIPAYLLKGIENLWPPKNLHVHVFNHFIHNCQILEAAKMSFSRWMNK